jgi:hypothetical protein
MIAERTKPVSLEAIVPTAMAPLERTRFTLDAAEALVGWPALALRAAFAVSMVRAILACSSSGVICPSRRIAEG